MNEQAIGIFDSGLGGLSVWQEVYRQMPHESIIYVADSAYCPYGSRPAAEVYVLSERIVRFLLTQPCKLITVACNTATAAAINSLRTNFECPFVGMEPAIKPAAQATQSGVVGILATKGTFRGAHFQKARQMYAQGVKVLVQEGQGLVELVERGETTSVEAYHLLRRYLAPMLEAGADQIVLGCSHYPFLRPAMQDLVAGEAQIVNPAPAVARQVQRLLRQHGLLASADGQSQYHFYTTGAVADLQRMVRELVPHTVYDRCQFWRIHLPWPNDHPAPHTPG